MDAKKTVNDNISIYIMYHFNIIHSPLDISFSDTTCTENLEPNSVINLSNKCIDDDGAHVMYSLKFSRAKIFDFCFKKKFLW